VPGAPGESVFEGVTVLLNHRVGEDFACDTINLRLGLVPAEAAVQLEFKILALADVRQAFVTHLLQRSLDSLALRIENALFEGNVDEGFHGHRD